MSGMYLWKRPPLVFKYWMKYKVPYKDRVFNSIVKTFFFTGWFWPLGAHHVGIHLPFEAVEYDPEWRGEGWKEDYTEDGRFKSDVRKKDKEL